MLALVLPLHPRLLGDFFWFPMRSLFKYILGLGDDFEPIHSVFPTGSPFFFFFIFKGISHKAV